MQIFKKSFSAAQKKTWFLRNSGFTIVEILVVVAIIAILAVFSLENIVAFQKNAVLDQATTEVETTLKRARNQSIAGELMPGEIDHDFNQDGLPVYGVNVNGSQVVRFRVFQRIDDPGFTRETLENYQLDPAIVTSSGETMFLRRSGEVSGTQVYTFSYNGAGTRQIDLDMSGVISITKI